MRSLGTRRADGDQGLRADFGDTVRIISTAATVEASCADRIGYCYGFTTPSITGVQVIGADGDDIALSVGFDDEEPLWFAASLVELIDVGAGQEMEIGGDRYVRNADGDWVPAPD